MGGLFRLIHLLSPPTPFCRMIFIYEHLNTVPKKMYLLDQSAFPINLRYFLT